MKKIVHAVFCGIKIAFLIALELAERFANASNIGAKLLQHRKFSQVTRAVSQMRRAS